jgi:ribosomal protein L16 Arg81 hydroxylase
MNQMNIAVADDALDCAQTALPAQSSASHFYDTATLGSLVSPVSEKEFIAEYWEKKPLMIHRGNPGYYGDLFTLEDFDQSITRGRGYIKTAEATAKTQAKHFGAGAAALERVMTDMRSGHTLIEDGVHEFHPKLGLFCRLLTQNTGARFQTNIYLTPPNGKGFTPHWDNHDVFVLQVMGSKHWKVEKGRRALPSRDQNIEEEGREFRGEVDSFTLEQGDVVYIPRGFVHAAECGSESSLHITLGIYPNMWDELLGAVAKAVALRDESLLMALPFGHMHGDGTQIVNRLADVLRKASDPAFLAQVLDQFRDETVKRVPLDIAGQVTSFFRATELKLDDKVGPRPGLFYTLRKGEDTVTAHVGSRAITFRDFFGEALNFALETPSYAIRDMPGDLEDDVKLVFVERLMQEAMIIRK